MKKSKLIAFTGTMGCGKTTAIQTLRDYAKSTGVFNVKFAQPLYDIQEAIYERIESVHTRPADFVKDRKLLQWLGTDWGRDTISETLWVDLWQSQVKRMMDSYVNAVITCDDVRYDNEGETVKSLGGIIIKLVREGDTNVLGNGIVAHKSESGIDSKYVDFTVHNNGTLEEFKKSLSNVYNEIFNR